MFCLIKWFVNSFYFFHTEYSASLMQFFFFLISYFKLQLWFISRGNKADWSSLTRKIPHWLSLLVWVSFSLFIYMLAAIAIAYVLHKKFTFLGSNMFFLTYINKFFIFFPQFSPGLFCFLRFYLAWDYSVIRKIVNINIQKISKAIQILLSTFEN